MKDLMIQVWQAIWEAAQVAQKEGMTIKELKSALHMASPALWNNIPNLSGIAITEDQVESWVKEFLQDNKTRKKAGAFALMDAITLPGEEWKVCDCDPRYYISNMGRAFSTRGTGKLMAKVLKHDPGKPGANYVYVCINGKKHSLHRLVAKAFIPNPNNYPQVDHIDENTANNKVDNLRWCTMEMNLGYYLANHGGFAKKKVHINPAKESISYCVLHNGTERKFLTAKSAAAYLGCSTQSVYNKMYGRNVKALRGIEIERRIIQR